MNGEDQSRRRLGRGLAALIGEIDAPQPSAAASQRHDGRVPIEHIAPNPRNPRRRFGDAELDDLAQSIREHGVVQPVVVRPAREAGRYEIIAGERRWRAAQRAGITDLPIIIREVDDRTALELALVENVQRSDLNPVEEALGYQQLVEDHGYSQSDLGQVIGKSRSHVANTLRLLKLPQQVLDLLESGALSAGHARTLITASDPRTLAKRIVEEGLTVRQAEALAQGTPQPGARQGRRAAAEKDADTAALERRLSDMLGLAVSIHHKQRGGEIRIGYSSIDQLELVCRRLER